MKRFLAVCAWALVLTGCNNAMDTPVVNTGHVVTEHAGSANITEGHVADHVIRKNAYDKSEALYELGKSVIVSSHDGGNIMVSPLSIERCFALAIEGADGGTKSELVDAVYSGLPFDETASDISKVCDEISTYYTDSSQDKDDGQDAFSTVNSIWTNSDMVNMQLLPDYVTNVGTKYHSTAKSIPFSKGPGEINTWVNDNTFGTIPSIIETLQPDDQAVLINATYFEGGWSDKFEPVSEAIDFTCSDGTVSNPSFMESYKDDDYISIKGRDAFVKRYNNGFYYVGILPNEEETPEILLSSLNYEDIKSGVNSFNDSDLILRFPKYTYDFDTSLVDTFESLGVHLAFSEYADFSKLATRPLKISDAIHKTHIEVDENGTKAAAVTAIIMNDLAAMPEQKPVKELTFNRPFLYLIMSSNDDMPVFVGIVNNLK